MQGTSVFAVLLVTAASFRLGPPLGIPNCTVDSPWRGLLRFIEGGNKYLMKVPPCVDNVNKTKIIEFYLEYTTSENLTANICEDYADYESHNSTGLPPIVNCTAFVSEFLCNAINGSKAECGSTTHPVVV